MKTSKLDFPFPARRVFTACKDALHDCGQFRSIKSNERTFRITTSRGFPIFGEHLSINIIATTSSTCEVEMKSSDKLLLNPFKIGNNVRNVKDLDQFIRNEVYRLCDASQLRVNELHIKLAKPEKRLR